MTCSCTLCSLGHLLYEMASGRELSVSRPSDTDLQRVKQSQVLEVLRFIFDGDKDSMPSLQQVLSRLLAAELQLIWYIDCRFFSCNFSSKQMFLS